MKPSERVFLSKIDNIFRTTPHDGGPFAALSEACKGKQEWRVAFDAARACHASVSSAFTRLKIQARERGDWRGFANVVLLSIPVWWFVGKGYAAAILRMLHVVEVFDLESGQATYDRFVRLAA